MQKRTIRLLALLCAVLLLLPGCGSGTEQKPGTFVFETKGTRPEKLSNVWMCPKSLDNGALIPGFADDLTNADNWPILLEHTSTIKLYIEYISRISAPDLKKIAAFVDEHKLRVSVEVGGVRAADPAVDDSGAGRSAAEREFLVLSKFLLAGGRIDSITTDHALASEITGRTKDRPDMTMQQYMQQQMEYYRYMIEKMPRLKVGAIESLGFFWVKSPKKQYKATDGLLDRVDFEEYMSELVRIAKENDIEIDHFEIDFGMHDIEYDGDWGRVLAVEDYVQGLGVRSGFIAGNAFHKGTIPLKGEENLLRAAQSAAERTLAYFEGYEQAGGHSDYLVFQRWQNVPVAVGDETTPLSSFGIFKSLLDSPYFPKD